jgi:hypothetical protein
VVSFRRAAIDSRLRRPTGGRVRDARRSVLATAFLLLIAGSTPAGGDSEPEAQVTVHEQEGVYSVTARFQVPQPPRVALAVLTDYAEIPRFMSQIKRSVVLERDGDHVVVEQEAVSRLMAFSKRVHLILDIPEARDALRFRDRCGRRFLRYEGLWSTSEQHGQTEIVYELTTKPAFDVPEFLAKRLLKRDSTNTIEQLRREMAGRLSR